MATRKPPPEPNQDLPEEPGAEAPVEPNQDLPDDPSQDEANRNRNQGKSEDAPGHNKPEPRQGVEYDDPENPLRHP